MFKTNTKSHLFSSPGPKKKTTRQIDGVEPLSLSRSTGLKPARPTFVLIRTIQNHQNTSLPGTLNLRNVQNKHKITPFLLTWPKKKDNTPDRWS
jgi:hypothetical protein